MPKHNNSSISDWILRTFRFKSGDSFSNELAPLIQAVIPITPVCTFAKNNSSSNGTTATVLTTDTNKDTYVVAVMLGVIKDVTSPSIASDIRMTVNGVITTPLVIPGIILTPQSEIVSLSFPFPIKVDRGTVISVNNGSATANIRSTAVIVGYTVETTASTI